MLAHLAARLAPLSRRGVLSLADEPKDDDDKKSSLRRFETILSADGAADIGNEDVAAEAVQDQYELTGTDNLRQSKC